MSGEFTPLSAVCVVQRRIDLLRCQLALFSISLFLVVGFVLAAGDARAMSQLRTLFQNAAEACQPPLPSFVSTNTSAPDLHLPLSPISTTN